MKYKLLGCCGVGGTGKTVTIEALLRLRSDVVFLPSIVRAYYASRGVTNEIEYHRTMNEEDRFEFQIGLLRHFMETTRERLRTALDTHHVVMDRSVFDHIAYSIYAHPNMTADQLKTSLSFAEPYLELDPRVVYFNYPTSWSWGDATEDGFRATGIGKNFVLDATMRHLLHTHINSRLIVLPEASIENRARILSAILDS